MNVFSSPKSNRSLAERMRCRRVAARLVPYSQGRLGRAERDVIEAHLDLCETCADDLATISGVAALLNGHVAEPPQGALPSHSADLWSRIEAEICPSDPGAAWDAPQRRSRRRFVFGIDPSWPSTVPVGVAMASAVLFGVVLIGGHHRAMPGNSAAQESTTVDAALLSNPISVSIRSLAPPTAVASASMIRPLHVRGNAGGAVPKPESALAEARALRMTGVRTDPFALVAPAESRDVALAAGPEPAHGVYASVARPAASAALPEGGRAMSVALSLPPSPASTATVAIAQGSPPQSAIDLPAVAVTGVETSSFDDGAAFYVQRLTAKVAGLPTEYPEAFFTADGSVDSDFLALGAGITSAVAAEPAAVATGAQTMPKKSDDGAPDDGTSDASIRGDTPAARPMVDLAAISRRQRGMFSYSSH